MNVNTKEMMEEMEREGATFLTYINSDGLRVSHPVKMVSLTNKPAPWFPRVYDPESVKEMTRNKTK